VAGRFQFSKPSRRGPGDPWFRVGDVNVGSAALLAVLCALSFVVYAVEGRGHPVLRRLQLIPAAVLDGQVWRIVTWPLANAPGLWVLVAIVLLWYFGTRLEDQVGRVPMLGYLIAIIIVPGIVGTALDLPQGGVRVVEIVVLLTYIAEYPHARFFFGIPAWAIGVAIVALDFLQLVGDRDGRSLLFYAVALATGALAARAIGLLDAYPWIPAIPVGRRGRSRARRARRARPRGRGAVVGGPWGAATTSAADQAELDGLLDKIAAVGMNGLSPAEKRRLNELSKRLRDER
jgi:membrane associated rhomboid family serine protease